MMLSSSASSASATVRVDKATSELLIGPDWTMNIDICDSINSNYSQVKDVVKAVKKRLQNKNPKVQFLALTLLEMMIKNCGDYVHSQVVERDILQEMIKIVKKKTDMQVREKILVLLDSWQEAFGGPGSKYPQYYWAYVELKRSGVQFPRRSPDSALIFTPPMHPTSILAHPQVGYGMPSSSSNPDDAVASETSNLSILGLDGIRSVMELLSEMLKAVNPNDRQAVKDDIIIDLASQCRSNQKKLMQFISSTGDEEHLGQGLALNDDLQSVLAKHDAIASGSPLLEETPETLPRPSSPFASAPVATNRFEEDEEDDDGFAQLARRNAKPKPTSTQVVSAECGVYVGSPSHSDAMTAVTTSGSTESSSSVASNRLALPAAPPQIKTVTKEQEMIDLLSITLSSKSSPPRTPPVTSPSSNQNGYHPSTSNGHGYPYSTQPYPLNKGYNPYNSYVAPWAQTQPQPQLQPQIPNVSSSYLVPPWEVPASANPDQFRSATYTFPASSANTFAASSPATYIPTHASGSLQRYNSIGSRVNNAVATGTQSSGTPGQAAPAAAAKPYILSNRLFEDLIDLRIPDGSLKMNRSPTQFSDTRGQGTNSERK